MADDRDVRSTLKIAQHGAYAHFPGTGPADKRCSDCAHLVSTKSQHKTRYDCAKWAALQKSMGNKSRAKSQPINNASLSCKYFEQAPPRAYTSVEPMQKDRPAFAWGTATRIAPDAPSNTAGPDDDDKIPF